MASSSAMMTTPGPVTIILSKPPGMQGIIEGSRKASQGSSFFHILQRWTIIHRDLQSWTSLSWRSSPSEPKRIIGTMNIFKIRKSLQANRVTTHISMHRRGAAKSRITIKAYLGILSQRILILSLLAGMAKVWSPPHQTWLWIRRRLRHISKASRKPRRQLWWREPLTPNNHRSITLKWMAARHTQLITTSPGCSIITLWLLWISCRPTSKKTSLSRKTQRMRTSSWERLQTRSMIQQKWNSRSVKMRQVTRMEITYWSSSRSTLVTRTRR